MAHGLAKSQGEMDGSSYCSTSPVCEMLRAVTLNFMESRAKRIFVSSLHFATASMHAIDYYSVGAERFPRHATQVEGTTGAKPKITIQDLLERINGEACANQLANAMLSHPFLSRLAAVRRMCISQQVKK